MKKQIVNDSLRAPDTTLHADKCQRLAGRASAIVLLFVFIAAYVYGISAFGLLLGISIGWLPCGLLAWLSARAVASLSAPVIRQLITT
jgi:hypothetical protein